MNKELFIDGSDHVAGKLGAFIAKKALEGHTVHVLCAESIILTGEMHRHVAAYKSYLNKRNIVNAARGAFHYKEPSKYYRKMFRNMSPRRTVRGQAANARIFVYEGIPKQFENVERSIVPSAFRKAVTNTDRKFITLGDLLSQFGWHHSALTKSLKDELLAREAIFAAQKGKKQEEVAKAIESSEFKSQVEKALMNFI